MSRLVGVIGAVLIHLTVVAPLLIPSCTPPVTPPPPPTAEHEETIVQLYIVSQKDEPQPPQNGDKGQWTGDDCPDVKKIYEGVGIIYDPGTGRVLQAPPSLPAYKAGVRVGDVFVNPYPGGSNGIRDGIAEFDFFRSAERFTVRIPTEKICFEQTTALERVGRTPAQ